MEEYEEYEEGGSSINKILIAVIVLLLLAIAAGCVYFFFIRKESEPERKGLGTGVGVALTQEELDAAMAEAARNAAGGAVGLKYKNGAYSKNGTDFDCYILNSESNLNDMVFEIYADEELTDKLFTSVRIPRGSGYNELELNHSLDKGVHTVYVVVSLVADGEDGEEKIVSQISHTMDFHVS